MVMPNQIWYFRRRGCIPTREQIVRATDIVTTTWIEPPHPLIENIRLQNKGSKQIPTLH
jgi:hypothetical protein